MRNLVLILAFVLVSCNQKQEQPKVSKIRSSNQNSIHKNESKKFVINNYMVKRIMIFLVYKSITILGNLFSIKIIMNLLLIQL
ncbi:hypothetical protein BSF42_43910 [Flavobacterium sp. ACN6]|nr:hypothetical protein BSF42_43910 [Flavobacterium sp. ACN6]